ncbi:MAG: hypothetical protein F9K18_03705 [Thermoanaerobaculia bacterium]|nr:MAG: hypothetical protein F9K18_03705 [Thermoanaerobaculia bacterium]
MRQAVTLLVVFALVPAARAAAPPPGGPEPPGPPRAIPGITAEDPHPEACVSCHRNMPEIGLDARLSTAMARWQESVDAELLAKARAAMRSGAVLTGRHPAATSALADVPAACAKCHSASSKRAPELSRLIHLVHLSPDPDNHYLSVFGGECTHCHKLDAATGEWSVPSGPEPPEPEPEARGDGR